MDRLANVLRVEVLFLNDEVEELVNGQIHALLAKSADNWDCIAQTIEHRLQNFLQ